MPTATTKNGRVYPDPGGDPATPVLYGTNPGGFVEVDGFVTSTQTAGWRQRLITAGKAT
jgi:hypothetical protein